jgi:hypothetical protein
MSLFLQKWIFKHVLFPEIQVSSSPTSWKSLEQLCPSSAQKCLGQYAYYFFPEKFYKIHFLQRLPAKASTEWENLTLCFQEQLFFKIFLCHLRLSQQKSLKFPVVHPTASTARGQLPCH